MKSLAAALALLLLLPAAARAAAPDGAPTAMVIGDSHVERLGPALSARLRELGARPLPPLARRGWSTGRYRRAGDLRQVLRDAGRPDVLIVCLGGNDHARNPRVYARQLEWVAHEARAAGVAEILWVGPAATDVGPRPSRRRLAEAIARNTRWQRDLLPSLGVTWIDSRAFTAEDHAGDGLHFNRDGYAHWSAALVARWADVDAPEHSALLSALAS